MAEYVEVCRQHDRMCARFEKCYDCPLHKKVVWCIKKIGERGYIRRENAEKAEKVIMEWAAENPEPTYPTWAEWFLRTCQVGLTGDGRNDWNGLLFSHIPAEIAQKLGVEPKEE
jgi:hypothetical protein